MDNQQLQQYALPVLMVAYIGWRALRFRKVKSKMAEFKKEGAVIVDVRSPGEYASGANPTSVNIPLGSIENRLSEIKKDVPVIVCCASGARSGAAASILKKHGFKNVTNAGPWTNTLA